MPTGLRYWIAGTVAGFAIVGAWLLPPTTQPLREAAVPTAEAIRLQDVDQEFRWTAEVLRRVLWSDSLSALAVKSTARGPAVLLPESETINTEYPARVRARIEQEIANLSAHDDGMRFAYVVQPHDHARGPDMGLSRRPRTETYAGTHDGGDYCLQLRMIDAGEANTVLSRRLVDADRGGPRAGFLGACRTYVAHGLPGRGIQEWLEGGGMNFGLRAGVPEAEQWISVGGRMVLVRRSNVSRPPIEVDRCLAGSEDACAAVFLHPADHDRVLASDIEVVRRSPATSIGTFSTLQSYLVDQEYLLADLEAEFGPAAFSRFWTSDTDVSTAFAEAFGIDVGSWMRSWVDRTVGIERPGPGLPRSASSGSMVTMLLLLGVAFLRNRGRRLT